LHRALAFAVCSTTLPLLASGCAAPEEEGPIIVFDACALTSLRLAPDASDAERDGVKAALALWQAAGGPPLAVMPASVEAVSADLAQILPIGFESAAPAFFGLYRPARGDILINRGLQGPDARAITVAHEIGHAFGLTHVTDRRSLMNPGNLQIPPGPDDAQLILERSACGH
jgi:hypothetical protein